MHVSQLAGNNLHVMSGPRRQPTCWAAPWRNSPPPSSSTRPRAPCPEPAPSARLQTKMAQQMQVLRRPHSPTWSSFLTVPPTSPPPHRHTHAATHTLVFSLSCSLCFYTHTQAHSYAFAHHLREIACTGESNAYLSNEYCSFTMAVDR